MISTRYIEEESAKQKLVTEVAIKVFSRMDQICVRFRHTWDSMSVSLNQV